MCLCVCVFVLYFFLFVRGCPAERDLHTVDDGVLSHLATELASNDWDVLVAHFLGVDHVGHTFGPASQAMEDKLGQMDAALRYTSESAYCLYLRFDSPCFASLRRFCFVELSGRAQQVYLHATPVCVYIYIFVLGLFGVTVGRRR